MASFNKISLIGNLGGDPETREYEGRKVTSFSLAVNEKNSKGEEKTLWFRASFWTTQAEVAEKYLKKGNQVFVEGRLSTREYTDSTGNKKFALEVLGQNLVLLGPNPNATESNSYSNNTASNNFNNSSTVTESTLDSVNEEDDLPF